jgi:hypothetical protein
MEDYQGYYPSYQPPPPPPPPKVHDPVAVAIGNASLLSVGYLMLGRVRLAVVTFVVTVGLLALLVTALPTVWFEILILLWWAAMIAHGWRLAGGQTRVVNQQRVVALVVAIPVLVAFGLLRYDAANIDGTVTAAKQSGNCAQALTALNGVWLGDRLANAPSTADGDQTVEACQRIQLAKTKLATGLNGDNTALKAAFDGLGSVLTDLPGHEKMVDITLDGFLAGLPTKDACHTAAVTDWLRARKATHNTLDRSATVVPRTAPDALVGCADNLMSTNDWQTAKKRYQQLIDQYPDNALVARAQDGVVKATQAIELANVRSLLTGSTDTQPAYCKTPAQYSAAPPYNPGGLNPSLIYGSDEYAKQLPDGWWVTDPVNAVAVVCAGDKDMGGPVQTCPYVPETGSFSDFPTDVTFHKIAIPVKVYELRTGKLITDRTIEIGGGSCPEHISYSSYITDLGPPGDMYVTSTQPDVQAAFGTVINP